MVAATRPSPGVVRAGRIMAIATTVTAKAAAIRAIGRSTWGSAVAGSALTGWAKGTAANQAALGGVTGGV